MMKGMELQSGMTPYSPMTFDCTDYEGCRYQMEGRCIYNIARLKVETGKYCYQDTIDNYYEDLADNYQ